jgi:hypothetical protein
VYDEREPDPQLACQRECDFAELLAALHELLGSEVELWLMGEPVASRRAPLLLRGQLEQAWEIGREPNAPIVFGIAGAVLSLSAETVTGALREEYVSRSSGRRWIVVWIEFSRSFSIEIEQIV